MPAGLLKISRSTVCALALALCAGTIAAEDPPLVILVQRLPSEEMPSASFQPLADYIGALAARPCVIDMPPNFPSYWEAVRRNRYDLAFDAPHFTDYRVQKLRFTVLLKTPGTSSYSLVMRADGRWHDPAKLVGKRVAALDLLSIGTLRLNALFPNPMRQPIFVEAEDSADAIDLLVAKRVAAAFLPTSLIGQRAAAQPGLAVVLTTEPTPRLVLSVSPKVAPELAAKIRRGLIRAQTTDAGRAMLQAIGLDYFDAATNDEFTNQSYVLRSYWGY